VCVSVCFTDEEIEIKRHKESCCSSFFVLSKENEREKEKEQKENKGAETQLVLQLNYNSPS
jgi:hypothetical protein